LEVKILKDVEKDWKSREWAADLLKKRMNVEYKVVGCRESETV